MNVFGTILVAEFWVSKRCDWSTCQGIYDKEYRWVSWLHQRVIVLFRLLPIEFDDYGKSHVPNIFLVKQSTHAQQAESYVWPRRLL